MITKVKILLSSLLVLAVSILSLAAAKAQDGLIFGQNHAYSVYVKSNKEAFVFARLALTNPGESPLKSSSFTLLNAQASEMAIYQVVLPQECSQYDYRSDTRKCVRYKEPSYTQDYSYYGSDYDDTKDIEYHKVNYSANAGKYSFELPKSVDPHKSTALVVIYATKDYVSSSLGRYRFNFETLAVDQRITEASVAVTAETGYRMKNSDKLDHTYSVGLSDGVASASGNAQKSFTNPDIDKLIYSIGGRGQINRIFKSITPNETASVKGMFASGWVKLYIFETIFTIIGLVGFFTILVFLSKKYNKRTRRTAKTSKLKNSSTAQLSFTLLNPVYWTASFVSALLVGGITFVITVLDRNNALDFLNSATLVVTVFATIMAGLVYLFAVFGPAIFVCTRYRWKAAVTVILLQFIWYVAAVLLLVNI